MKIKNLMQMMGVTVCLLTSIYACKTTPAATYETLIPKDAQCVIDVNVQSLLTKSGITDADKQFLLDKLKSDIPSETYALVEQMIKDPSGFGLALDVPITMYFTNSVEKPGFLMKLNKPDKLKSLMEKLRTMEGNKDHLTVTNKDGLTIYTVDNGEIHFAIGETAAAVVVEQPIVYVTELFKQTAENSFVSTPLYKALNEKQGDFRAVMSYKLLMDRLMKSAPYITSKDFGTYDLSEIGLSFAISAEPGDFQLTQTVFGLSDEADKQLQEYASIVKPMHQKFIAAIPANAYTYIAANINGKKYWETIMHLEFLKVDTHHIFETFFKTIEGDIAFAVTPASGSMIPDIVFYAETKNADVLKCIYDTWQDANAPKTPMKKISDNEYQVNIGGFLPVTIYLGYKDGYLYVTNAEKYRTVKKLNGESLATTEYGKHAQNTSAYGLLNGEELLGMPTIALAFAGMGGNASQIYSMAKKYIKSLEVYNTGGTYSGATAHFYLMDTKTNALKQVVDLIRPYLEEK